MKIIVGLGNPGTKYENSRHNAGFMVLNELNNQLEFDDFKTQKKFKAETSEGTINNEKIVLIKPQTFMNLSGECVIKLLQFFKVEPVDLWVIYDDVDLPLGQIRIRKEGSAGTHNGMKSIIQSLDFASFPRYRIGIESRGVTSPEQMDTKSFVLSDFSKDELEIFVKSAKKAAEAILLALNEDIESAMNEYNA